MKTLIAASLTSVLIFSSMAHTAVAQERVTKQHHRVTGEYVRNAHASMVPFAASAYQSGARDEALGSGLAGH
jgi:hypothetical protein